MVINTLQYNKCIKFNFVINYTILIVNKIRLKVNKIEMKVNKAILKVNITVLVVNKTGIKLEINIGKLNNKNK